MFVVKIYNLYNEFPLDIQVFIICNKIFCQIVPLLYKRIKGYKKKRKNLYAKMTV